MTVNLIPEYEPIGQTRVHLDEVVALEYFVELEVVLEAEQSEKHGEAVAAELLEALRMESSALLEGAYIDLHESQTT